MDWNKTKTIFIIIFSILNVFLYSLYLNRLTETQNLQVMGKTTIEDSLKLDNISYKDLPTTSKESFFISAKIVTFAAEQLENFKNQHFTIQNGTDLQSTLIEPVSVRNLKDDYDFSEFLSTYVLNGSEYVLWKIDEEADEALFFQRFNKYPIYFSQNAMLRVHLNEDKQVIGYEQRMFDEIISFNKKKDLLSPIEALGSLSSRGHLKSGSTVVGLTLGFSTLVQITETHTQVFAPTWHVRVQLEDGKLEDYFINAIEGKILELHFDKQEEEQE